MDGAARQADPAATAHLREGAGGKVGAAGEPVCGFVAGGLPETGAVGARSRLG